MLNNLILSTDNSSLSEKKSKVIADINTEAIDLNNKINAQNEKREYILKFIENMDNLLKSNQSEEDTYKLTEIKENAMKIIEQVEENINILSSLNSKLNELSVNVFNLNENAETHIQNIQELDNSINSYHDISEESTKKLMLNDLKIDYFVKDNVSKSFIVDFSPSSDTANTNPISQDSDLKDNNILVVSETKNEVLLPYKVSEINEYINQYPSAYKSFDDVIKKEFTLPLSYYMKHPSVARFRETYSLIRDRESNSIIEALKYAIDLMFKFELNPTIIAACKTQEQLERYLSCLENNNLENFKDFEIKFEINPI